jgi:hypothetical protein
MKKKLETELMSLAHRILQSKNRADVHELKAMAGMLHEKLSVLSYAEKHFEGQQPTIGKKDVEKSLSGNENERYAPDGTLYNPEGITEPNTEKIKDIVAQMPPEAEDVDRVLEEVLPENKKQEAKNQDPRPRTENAENQNDDFRKHSISYDDLPQFEPVRKNDPKDSGEKDSIKTEPETSKPLTGREEKDSPPTKIGEGNDEPKKLHQKLRKGVSFGLNERVVFVKHLFGGNVSDYDRVLSQLNTIDNFPEAKDFIENTVKPDYDWKGEEKYEKQFLTAVKDRLD